MDATQSLDALAARFGEAIASDLPAGANVAVSVVVTVPHDCSSTAEGGQESRLQEVGKVRPLTTAEAAELAGQSQNTVAGWCRDGLIAGASKTRGAWRVPLEALRAYLNEDEEPTGPAVVPDDEGERYSVPDEVFDAAA